jgi:hypothetical protein
LPRRGGFGYRATMLRRVAFVLVSTLALNACDDGTEGEPLGVFVVQATRTANTCGAQMSGKLQSARFNVSLALQSGVLRWTPEGAVAASGSYDVYQRTFRIAVENSTQAIAANRRLDIPGCVLRRVDVIEGVLDVRGGDAGTAQDAGGGVDAGAAVVGSFRGHETIAYGTESGDCSALIGVGQGQALALPCQVGYDLVATRVGP